MKQIAPLQLDISHLSAPSLTVQIVPCRARDVVAVCLCLAEQEKTEQVLLAVITQAALGYLGGDQGLFSKEERERRVMDYPKLSTVHGINAWGLVWGLHPRWDIIPLTLMLNMSPDLLFFSRKQKRMSLVLANCSVPPRFPVLAAPPTEQFIPFPKC